MAACTRSPSPCEGFSPARPVNTPPLVCVCPAPAPHHGASPNSLATPWLLLPGPHTRALKPSQPVQHPGAPSLHAVRAARQLSRRAVLPAVRRQRVEVHQVRATPRPDEPNVLPEGGVPHLGKAWRAAWGPAGCGHTRLPRRRPHAPALTPNHATTYPHPTPTQPTALHSLLPCLQCDTDVSDDTCDQCDGDIFKCSQCGATQFLMPNKLCKDVSRCCARGIIVLVWCGWGAGGAFSTGPGTQALHAVLSR